MALNTNLHSERPDNVLRVVLDGVREPLSKRSGFMTGFRDHLDDAQIAAVVTYVRTHFGNNYTDTVTPAMMIGLLGGLVLGLVISFKATMAPYLSIPYAACEGLAIGGMSALLERRYPGIAVRR